jgi:hypothetical protein
MSRPKNAASMVVLSVPLDLQKQEFPYLPDYTPSTDLVPTPQRTPPDPAIVDQLDSPPLRAILWPSSQLLDNAEAGDSELIDVQLSWPISMSVGNAGAGYASP